MPKRRKLKAKNINTLISKISNTKAGVFIDDSNLYYAQKEIGWRVDWGKLKKFLESFCELSVYNYYVAIPDKADANYSSTTAYLKYVKKYAVIRKKPLKYIKTAKAVVRKGDVDVEIVLDVVRNISKLDTIFIVSGDSDYLELKKWVVKEKKKKIVFVSFESNMAWELRQSWHIYLNRIEKQVRL